MTAYTAGLENGHETVGGQHRNIGRGLISQASGDIKLVGKRPGRVDDAEAQILVAAGIILEHHDT